MKDEPSRIIAAITAAITATIGVLVATSIVTPELGGSLTVAAGAWVLAAGEIIRARVTPNGRVAAVYPPPPAPEEPQSSRTAVGKPERHP